MHTFVVKHGQGLLPERSMSDVGRFKHPVHEPPAWNARHGDNTGNDKLGWRPETTPLTYRHVTPPLTIKAIVAGLEYTVYGLVIRVRGFGILLIQTRPKGCGSPVWRARWRASEANLTCVKLAKW